MVKPVKFTRESGCLARDEFLVISEEDHMLTYIFVIDFIVGHCTTLHWLVWGICSRELSRINFGITF